MTQHWVKYGQCSKLWICINANLSICAFCYKDIHNVEKPYLNLKSMHPAAKMCTLIEYNRAHVHPILGDMGNIGSTWGNKVKVHPILVK